MDDFDFDEQQEQEQLQNDNNLVDNFNNARERYERARENIDRAKQNVDKAKNFREGMRKGSKAGSEGAKRAGSEGAKKAGGEVAKKAGGEAAKKAGGEAAKGAAKLAAKEGAKAGAKGALAASGAVTAGAGTAAAAAIQAAEIAAKKAKEAAERRNRAIKENTGIDVKKTKKATFVGLILLPFLIIFFLTSIVASGAMYLASENTYDDLSAIIKKRQTRYAESGRTFKSILMMTNAEINEILVKDYLEQGQSIKTSNPAELDLSYLTYLKNLYNGEYDNYIPSDSNDPNNTYSEKIGIIEKYLKASRSNFNKIKWVMSGSSSGVEIKNYDLTDNLGGVSLSGAAAALMNASNNYLSMPNLEKYKSSPSSTAEEMKSMYISMVEKYLQPWAVPYALNIASQNNDFGKSVLNDMYHPITVTLYELDRLTRTTVTYYYLETTVKVDHYTEDRDCNPDGSGGQTCSSSWEYSYTSYQDSTTATTWTDSNSTRYSVSLKTDGSGYIRAGVKSGPNIDRDQKPYRHVPKLTSAEAFYEVLTARYDIKPINEANTPTETSTTLDADGKETIIDLFDETLTSLGSESKPYQVSYEGTENLTFPRKSKGQKEQIKAKYIGTNGAAPTVQAYSYDQLSFGYAQIEKYYHVAAGGGVIGSSGGSLTNIPAGGFAWPVPAIVTSGVNIDDTISSPFGMRGAEFHPAIDIKAMGIGLPGDIEGVSYGPPIVAAQSGTVHVKSDADGYGPQYIIIDHKNGYYTLYGHFYSICVTDGQEVTQGQTIGVMGTEGHSDGVHLHFGIYQTDRLEGVFDSSKAMNPKLAYNSDCSPVGGVTNTGTNVIASTSNQPVMDQMCAKAIEQAGTSIHNIDYESPGEGTASDEATLRRDGFRTDCSGFVSSLYRIYLGVETGRGTGAMISNANSATVSNGWTPEYHEWNGDVGELLPGDMLLRRSEHVGLYVGNGKQVDNGSGRGPNYKDVSPRYTHYIRYTNPNVVATTASTTGTTGTTGPAGKKISRVEWYLDYEPATNDLVGGGTGTSGGSGLGSTDLYSYLMLAEGGYDLLSADGTQYRVHNDGAGIPTVGMGVAIKSHYQEFRDLGVPNPEALSYVTPDYVDKAIVDQICQREIDVAIQDITDKLTAAGITLKDYQITVLVSRRYNGADNLSKFIRAYKMYGETQPLYDEVMKYPNTGEGVGFMQQLQNRRDAEWRLFTTGVYPDSIY